LLLGDIIPTGYFAALQALSHPNVRGRIEGEMPYPISTGIGNPVRNVLDKDHEAAQSTIVTIAVIGLGPVGICAVLSLLSILRNKRPSNFRILAIDPLEQRRHKLERIADTISWLKETSILHCAPPDRAVELLQSLSINETGNLVELFGCDAVVDAVGSNAALRLSYELIRHFGVIASVGVHTAPTLGLNGDELYSKNVSMCFGRCPVGSMFPYALSLFDEFLDILGGIGKEISLIERIVGMDNEADVREAYSKFDSGEWGKLVFRP
jgi:threonine dehydrogenase-like Zn-dependent dehydrogenase